MARPRAASDEEIIAAAEELAKEIGWKKVFANTVFEKMGVGGSLGTFSKIIKDWRAEKESSEASNITVDVSEVVEDRETAIDDDIKKCGEFLISMRLKVLKQIDEAVAEERQKSDRIRRDEREAHEKIVSDLRFEKESIIAEIDGLAEESANEAARADAAEDRAEILQSQLNDAKSEVSILTEASNALRKEKDELDGKVSSLIEASQEAAIASEREIEKEEKRADAAEEREKKASEKLEEIRSELKKVNAELSTARVDVANARADRSRADEKLKSATAEIEAMKKEIEAVKKEMAEEKARADLAWDRVDELQKKLPLQEVAPASTDATRPNI